MRQGGESQGVQVYVKASQRRIIAILIHYTFRLRIFTFPHSPASAAMAAAFARMDSTRITS